jgi:tetratricopeptide (TPR) repeat protein
MARKKRQIQEIEATGNNPATPATAYQDDFQSKVGKKVEEFGKVFEGKGKTILYALLGLIALAIIVNIAMSWSRKSSGAEQAALGKAIETSQAQVSASPQPAGSTTKTFKTEKERAEASVAEFQAVVDKYGSEKAKYFVAVNKMSIDRAAAVSELEALSKSSGEVGVLAKFALAQAKEADGKSEEAAALYSELVSSANGIISKTTLNFRIASLYEKQGKKEEAANLYFEIAKTASEAKDADGKAVPMSSTGRESKEKLQTLNPEKAKLIKEAEPEIPSGMPSGL